MNKSRSKKNPNYYLAKKFFLRRTNNLNVALFREVERVRQKTGEKYKGEQLVTYYSDYPSAFNGSLKHISLSANTNKELKDIVGRLEALKLSDDFLVPKHLEDVIKLREKEIKTLKKTIKTKEKETEEWRDAWRILNAESFKQINND